MSLTIEKILELDSKSFEEMDDDKLKEINEIIKQERKKKNKRTY